MTPMRMYFKTKNQEPLEWIESHEQAQDHADTIGEPIGFVETVIVSATFHPRSKAGAEPLDITPPNLKAYAFG